MTFLYVFLGIMIVVIIVEFIIKPIIKNKDINILLNKVADENSLKLTKAKHKDYNYTLEDDKSIFYIRILEMQKSSCITVNHKTTWSLTWGGSRSNPGKRLPYQRYANELIEFLKDEYVSKKSVFKIVLVYKESGKILKYINESELKDVTLKDDAYGIKIINYTNFEENFKILKEGKISK